MSPRHRRKAKVSLGKVYDRRSADLPINAEVAPIEIKDPYGDRVVSMRSLRDDPLARLHSRRQIDDAQYQAGRAYQRDWETAERGPRAIDPTREAVDGGRIMDPLSDARMAASDRINEAIDQLGPDGASIVHDVLVTGLSMSLVAARRGWTGRSWIEYFGKRFRECLERLAVVYGYATRQK